MELFNINSKNFISALNT